MTRADRHGRGRRAAGPAVAIAAGLALGLAPAAAARAGTDRAADGVWFSAGALAGSSLPDATLESYQWDTRAQMAWGAQGLAGRGPLAAGLRLWRSRTTQRLGLPGTSEQAKVRSTSVELVGQGRLATVWGTDLHAIASVGRLHLGYQPDRVAFDPGTGSPIVVELGPVDEWIAGGGLALRRPLAGPWTVGLEADLRFFGLDAAHRNGSAIEYRRESFGEWGARFELAWLHRHR
jgi:hypothetical protein